jgi:ribosomal protein S18 acetylase RimI-like enzyme
MSNYELIEANVFSIEALTEIYNQTRIDYIVPMPMNATRLQEYIDNYDLDLTRSVVAQVDGNAAGLAMLGVREGHTWITRLGVVPGKRNLGIGEALMKSLINQSWKLKVKYIGLEVIINNTPAYRLFRKLGFEHMRDLLILRRPPGSPRESVIPYVCTLINDQNQVLNYLSHRRSIPSWLDDYPSLQQAGNMHALEVELETGGKGWLVYQKTIFQLGRIVAQTEKGNPYEVGRALLHALHTNNPVQDTKTENLPRLDTHLQAFLDMNYLESFARIEMRLDRQLM